MFFMRKILNYTFTLLLILLASRMAIAQNGQSDVRFTVKNFDCATNKVTIQVQVKAHDAAHTFLMGDANYRFDYDPRLIRNPTLVSQDNFSNFPPANDLNYAKQNLNGSSVGTTLGTVSLNTIYGGGGLGAKPVGTDWMTVSCITFDVLDGSQCFNLLWHTDTQFPVTGMNEVELVGGGDYNLYIVTAGGIFGNANICTSQICSGIFAYDDINITNKNTPISGNILTNDNSNGGAMTVTTTPLNAPTNGTITLAADGSYTYTPTAGFVGTDSMRYRVCNVAGLCDTAVLRIQVLDLPSPTSNNAPIAQNDNATTLMGTPTTGNVLSNDFDPNTNTLTVNSTPISSPTNGTLVLNPNGTFTYTPTSGFFGQDTFRYQVCDNGIPSLCDTAMVVINVLIDNNAASNNPPAAQDDAVMTYVNTPKMGDLKANDSDPNGNTLTYNTTPLSNPAHGTVVINPNGTFTFTPTAGFIGSDQFKYVVCDNGTPSMCDTATAYIEIYPIPNLPPVVSETPQTVLEDTPTTLCVAITDPNAMDTHTVTLCGVQNGTATATVNNATHQVCVTYTPTPNYNGKDTVCVIVCDSGTPTLCDTAKIPVTVTPVNDRPIVTIVTPPIIQEDTTITVCGTIADPDAGNTFTATPCGAAHGTTTVTVTGTQVCLTYTPTPNFNGTDTLCVIVCDNAGACDTVKRPITILPINDTPVVTEIPKTVNEDTPITICQTITDPDAGDIFTATPCGAAHGTLGTPSVSGGQVCITYTPSANYVGVDTVCVIVCDQTGLCDTAKIPVTVSPVNDAPVVTQTPKTTNEDTPITICQTITDPDAGDTHTATACGASHGTLGTPTVSGGQVCVTYTPAANYNGLDTICVTVCDQAGACVTVKTPVTISPVNDAPVVTETPKTVTEDTPITICQTITDPDAGDIFTASPCGAAHGTLGTPSVSGGQVCVTYTPSTNYVGVDTVCVIVCDQAGACVTVKTPITVSPVNDTPVVTATPKTTNEDTPITICQTITDPDAGDTHTVTACGASHGTLGTPSVSGGQVCVTYTPTANYNGQDTICLIVCDQAGACVTVKTPVTITPVNDAPVVSDITTNAPNNQPTTTCTPISDVDGTDTHTVTACGSPLHGSITATVNNVTHELCVAYTPTSGYVGVDNACFIVCDNGTPSKCDTVQVIYNVTATNRQPVALNDMNNTISGAAVSGNVLGNDSDPDLNTLTVTPTPIRAPMSGTITLSANGNYTYTPNAGFVGTDTVAYKVCDNGIPSLCDTAFIILEVRPVNVDGNQKPIANDDNTSTPANTPIIVAVKSNDFDPQGGVLGNPTLIGTATGGTAVVNPNGTVTFTPAPGFIGMATAQYQICDNGTPSLCDTASININVYPDPNLPNLAPIAVADAVSTPKNTPITGNVSTNDSDPNAGQILTFTRQNNPVNGTVVFLPNGIFTYTPNNNFVGVDSFRYQVCDNGLPALCTTAWAYITVTQPIVTPTNIAPVATDDTPVTVANTPIIIDVKANDYDPNGHPLGNPTILTTSPNGTAKVNPDGTITFTPNPNFVGTTSFTYQICDTGTPVLCDDATVTVTVRPTLVPQNIAPVAQDDAYSANMNNAISGNISTNDSDPNVGQTLTFGALTAPTRGFVTVNANGTFSYSPAVNFVGRDSFRYRVCDNGTPSLCDTATVYLELVNNPTNTNLAPVATNDNPTTTVNTPVVINVKANDYDPNGTPLTNNPTLVGTPVGGTPVVNPDGTVTFTPNPNFTGTATFQYQICDSGSPALCATATVFVTVIPAIVPANVAPIAINDATTTPQDVPISGDVSANDSDLNVGQTLTYNVQTTPLHGTVVLQPNGSYTYTPTAGFVGKDSLQYRVCDNGTPSLCTTAWLVVDVTPTGVNSNLPPNAMNDNATTTAGVPVVINVKANDTDPNGQPLTNPEIIGAPVGGTVVVNPDGTVTFTPTIGFIGTATFSYAVCDNSSPALCDTALVMVTVIATPAPVGVNLAPVAGDDANTTYKNTSLTASVASNDTDPNAGQTLTFSLTASTTHGTVSLNANGTYTYTPTANYTGPDQFTYQVCDNGTPSKCDTAVVYLTIFESPCVTMNLKVLLEGPFNAATGKMKTILNQRGLLPGQTPIGQFAIATPAGQPFKGAPWNYAGTETVATYASTVVDWVLVSIRTDNLNASSTIYKVAGLLHDDGRIEFINPCFNLPVNGTFYVVIEHRNHMGVMSPTALSIVNGKITFDFTTLDSYIVTNPPSFGQKQIGSKWVMYAGDGKKNTQTTNFDINFNDSQLWKLESGIFDQYRQGDFNMDADVNFNDQVMWKYNNGRYSGVPH
jgi:hypothetical protein